MNRRAFLSLIGMAAPAMVLDPERLLWVPGQKTFFLPPVVATPAELLVTPDWITRETLRILTRSMPFTFASNWQTNYGDIAPARLPVMQMRVSLPQRFQVAS